MTHLVRVPRGTRARLLSGENPPPSLHWKRRVFWVFFLVFCQFLLARSSTSSWQPRATPPPFSCTHSIALLTSPLNHHPQAAAAAAASPHCPAIRSKHLPKGGKGTSGRRGETALCVSPCKSSGATLPSRCRPLPGGSGGGGGVAQVPPPLEQEMESKMPKTAAPSVQV